jgi:hypothetical protein
MLVIYKSIEETFVVTEEKEDEFLKRYFELEKRNIDNYDRIKTDLMGIKAEIRLKTKK